MNNRDNLGLFSQLDPRWRRQALGNTIYTIRDWGCTVCSICMMIFYLFKEVFLPSEAAKLFQFTKDGKVYWGSVKYRDLKFKGRYYKRPSSKKMAEYTNDPKKAMLVEVNYNHWVLLRKWTIPQRWWWMCGEPYAYPARFRKRSKWSITGYAMFEREDS